MPQSRIILRVVSLLPFLTVEMRSFDHYFQVANLGVKISVVTPISIYAFCLSIQTVVQFAGTKVRNSFHITAIYDGLKVHLYEKLTPNALKQHIFEHLSKEKRKAYRH